MRDWVEDGGAAAADDAAAAARRRRRRIARGGEGMQGERANDEALGTYYAVCNDLFE